MTTTLRTLRLEYSLPDAVLRGNSRAHHMVKYKAAKKMRDDATMLGLREGLEHTYAKARITYRFFNNRWIDLDNLVTGMAAFQNGLRDAMVFPDDTPDHVVLGEHTFMKCAKGESRVEVLVEEIR